MIRKADYWGRSEYVVLDSTTNPSHDLSPRFRTYEVIANQANNKLVLPDARFLYTLGGPVFLLSINTSNAVIVDDASGSQAHSFSGATTAQVMLLDNSTQAGTWTFQTT